MSKQQPQSGLMPRLRFPEFREAEEWKENKMGKVLKESPRPITMNEEKEYSLVTVKRRYGGVVSRGILKGKSIKVKSQFLLEENDFLISNRQIVHCACGVVPKPLAGSIVSNEYSVLRACEGFDIFFLDYFSRQPIVSRSFLKCSIGIVIEKMLFKLNDWLKEKFLFPPIAEQQKIADCLSSLDALIAAQADKLDALKTHKKGLMQQLFPREGETVPRLRFPEFREAGRWENKPLKKVFSIFQGFAFSSKDATKIGIRWLKIADVGIQYMDSSTLSYLPANHKNEHERFLVRLDDYVIALTRPILGKQLKIAKVNSVYDGALLNQRVGKLVTDENKDFVYYLLQTSQLIGDIEKNIAGNDPPNLSSQQIGDIFVRVPKSDEQQKIADCLSSLDALIAAQADKLDALKAHKKGLMQQLFPGPEA